MSPNDFLMKFALIVALALTAAYFFTYFQVREYSTSKQVVNGVKKFVPNHKVTSASVTTPVSGTAIGAEPEAIDNPYSLEKYPVPHGAGGNLKTISPDLSSITLTGTDNNDIRAIITDKTEVFRNDARAELSAIEKTDHVTILGRKESEDGTDFVADSIHATEITDHYVPVVPLEHDGGN
jgi:hypothetical protein